MAEESLTNPSPQFKTAEYPGQPGEDRCETCGQLISESYYRVNGAMTCPACAEQAKFQLPQDSHPGVVRALLFGAGGALLGLILYATFAIVTGWIIGYVSLAVGYIVGKAVMKGSNGIGGRRYQVMAAMLTYAAVSVAAIPIAISQWAKETKGNEPPRVEQSQPNSAPAEQEPQTGSNQGSQPEPADQEEMSVGKALGVLLLVGLISPFLELQDPLHGLIGLVILFIGIQIAWRLTAGTTTDILGPFRTARASGQANAG